MNKRDFLKSALFGSGAVGLRSLLTGLPPAFLMYRSVALAQEQSAATFTILSHGQPGHPINANGPGTYPNNPNNENDPLRFIDHPRTSDLNGVDVGVINGVAYPPATFQTPVDLTVGSSTVKAAGPWAALQPALLQRTSFFHISTQANAHPEFINVMKFHGAIKGPTGTGQETLASFLAQENAAALGTLTNQPVNVGGNAISFDGRPLGVLDPTELKSLFGGAVHPTRVDPSQFLRLRDAAIDEIYRDVRSSGSHAQKAFLERYALGRNQAAQLGDSLAPLLADIQGNGQVDEIRAAVALIRLRITPVVVLQLHWGRDNHQDDDLAREYTETIASINSLRLLWDQLVAAGVENEVTFANLDVFGRTLTRNKARDGAPYGGRDHNRNHHLTMMFGPKIAPGVVGGLEPTFRNGNLRDFKAIDIGSIPYDQTLESSGKTLAKAVGVPDERISLRISGGQTIDSALQS